MNVICLQFFLACFASAVNGVVMPLFSVVFSNMINVFYGDDPESMKKESIKYLIAFMGIGVGSFLVCPMSVTVPLSVILR